MSSLCNLSFVSLLPTSTKASRIRIRLLTAVAALLIVASAHLDFVLSLRILVDGKLEREMNSPAFLAPDSQVHPFNITAAAVVAFDQVVAKGNLAYFRNKVVMVLPHVQISPPATTHSIVEWSRLCARVGCAGLIVQAHHQEFGRLSLQYTVGYSAEDFALPMVEVPVCRGDSLYTLWRNVSTGSSSLEVNMDSGDINPLARHLSSMYNILFEFLLAGTNTIGLLMCFRKYGLHIHWTESKVRLVGVAHWSLAMLSVYHFLRILNHIDMAVFQGRSFLPWRARHALKFSSGFFVAFAVMSVGLSIYEVHSKLTSANKSWIAPYFTVVLAVTSSIFVMLDIIFGGAYIFGIPSQCWFVVKYCLAWLFSLFFMHYSLRVRSLLLQHSLQKQAKVARVLCGRIWQCAMGLMAMALIRVTINTLAMFGSESALESLMPVLCPALANASDFCMELMGILLVRAVVLSPVEDRYLPPVELDQREDGTTSTTVDNISPLVSSPHSKGTRTLIDIIAKRIIRIDES